MLSLLKVFNFNQLVDDYVVFWGVGSFKTVYVWFLELVYREGKILCKWTILSFAIYCNTNNNLKFRLLHHWFFSPRLLMLVVSGPSQLTFLQTKLSCLGGTQNHYSKKIIIIIKKTIVRVSHSEEVDFQMWFKRLCTCISDQPLSNSSLGNTRV